MTEQQTELFDQSKATCLGMFSIPVGQIEVADGFLNPTREFIESVREFGVLEPITVKKMPSEDGIVDHYEVIMGRRRVIASRIVGLENIDAVVYEAGEWNYALLTLIENQQRSRNPIAEFQAVRKLILAGASTEAICKATGMSKPKIKKALRLFDLPAAVLEAAQKIDKHGYPLVSISACERIMQLPQEHRDELIQTLETKGRLTHDDIKEVTHKRREDSLKTVAELSPDLFAPVDLLPAAPSELDRLYTVLAAIYETASDASLPPSKRLEAIVSYSKEFNK